MRFLRRKVKGDGKGLYVHLGGCRLRPRKPKKTCFEKGCLVSMAYEDKYFPIAMKIFNNSLEYEVWKSKERT